jgi:hypothetical protein
MLWRVFKKVILWSYGRTTWQYDVLCVAILAFVFLTPKGWFERGELACAPTHQSGLGAVRSLRITGSASARPDAQDIERCVRKVTGNSDLRVKAWRELPSAEGRTAAFEVDIEP